MNFLEYIKSLVPIFNKSDITVSCEMTQASLSQHTIPAFSTASSLWKGQKFKSKEIQDYVKYYERVVGLTRNENMISSIHSALVNSLTILNALGDEAKQVYSDKEANISMTYLKTTIIRIIQSCEFANTYSRRFLNYLYYLETKEINAENDSSLSHAEVKWITDGFSDFCNCIKMMQFDTSIIKDHLKDLPNATISDLTEKTFVTTIGMNKLDPFNIRHLSARVNPFYLVGMWVAEWQANKYKSAKAELELLQLRKFNLEKQMANEPDAKLEKEIDYMQNRVSGLIYDLEKMEEKYA